MIVILPAEHLGTARAVDGVLNVGGLNVSVPWGNEGRVDVYVRRSSDDLSIIEIHMARHDGLAQEELDEQNRQAEEYPLGPKEYWRGVMVGKYTSGPDNHLLTNEEFDTDWDEFDADDSL
jgi:hypothetical protein